MRIRIDCKKSEILRLQELVDQIAKDEFTMADEIEIVIH